MELVAGIIFSLILICVSFSLNRWLLGRKCEIDVYNMALTASAVLLLAVVAESLVNPLYTLYVGNKLWEYHIFPLHDGNVSALAVVVWSAYGIHLYFTRQTLQEKLPARWRNNYGKALIIGFEAPFVFEISGNLTFLHLSDRYYAYYLPGDVGHLTSFQVVPVYVLCVFVGLVVLAALERLPRRRVLPSTLFAAGVAYLLAG